MSETESDGTNASDANDKSADSEAKPSIEQRVFGWMKQHPVWAVILVAFLVVGYFVQESEKPPSSETPAASSSPTPKPTSASPTPSPTAEDGEIEIPEAFKDDPGLITRDDLGEFWPLTVDYGALSCRSAVIGGQDIQSVTFRVPNMQYAVNGAAQTHSPFPPIDDIWADDPEVKGLKIPLKPLIEHGLALCD